MISFDWKSREYPTEGHHTFEDDYWAVAAIVVLSSTATSPVTEWSRRERWDGQ